MKKKFDIQYGDGAGGDMQYYLKQFKKEAMKKAENIFGESESAAKDAPSNQDAEHFDMTDMYKTSHPKPEQGKEKGDNDLKEILEQIKTTSQRIASEIFKND